LHIFISTFLDSKLEDKRFVPNDSTFLDFNLFLIYCRTEFCQGSFTTGNSRDKATENCIVTEHFIELQTTVTATFVASRAPWWNSLGRLKNNQLSPLTQTDMLTMTAVGNLPGGMPSDSDRNHLPSAQYNRCKQRGSSKEMHSLAIVYCQN
jgi:hypothetical protein